MANVISTRMLVLTSVEDNNNKFWEATLYDNDDVKTRWGRVGVEGQSKTFSGVGQRYIDTKIREKQNKGYKEMQVVGRPGNTTTKNITTVQSGALKSVAKKQIKYSNPTVEKLIEHLVKVNRHDIVTQSGGKISVDIDTGLIKTDVGVAVTLDTLDRARDYLVAISKCIKKSDLASKDFIESLNEYLMCVPQKVGSRRGWEKNFITSDLDVQKQGALIDSMESTLKALANSDSADTDITTQEEKVFDVKLELIEDKQEITRINTLYKSTLQGKHACSHLKLKNIYDVQISTMKAVFEQDGAKLTNIWELWHGTRAANLLSILKSGLIIPSSKAAHVTGRLFGDGVYFSDQSTKSLNYSYGYWDGASKDNNCFMFLASVAMGKYYVPRSGVAKIPTGYDSCFAKAGESSVINNEMIVYRTGQCNLAKLIEFGPG